MAIDRIAVIFDRQTRPETTGVYCLRALEGLCHVEHIDPGQILKLQPGQFDLFLAIDDGLRYELPTGLGPSAWWAIDTHLAYDWCLARAGQFDFVFAAQRDGAEKLRSAGIGSARWLPLACDPYVHRSHPVAKTWDVSFVGNLFPGPRADLVALLRRHFPSHFVGRAYFEEMAHTYSASRAVFNRSIRNDVNMRVFEALACGSLLVTNDLADNGQAEFFQDGIHLATYREADELLDKLRFYLAHEATRERVAAHGREEVVAHHTYVLRMQEIISTITKQTNSLRIVPHPTSTAKADGTSATGAAALASVHGCNKDSCRCRRQVAAEAAATMKDPSYFEFARPEILARIPPSARRILEIGCGAGRLGAALKARQSAEVVGVEFDEGAAAAARQRLDRVVVGDIERLEPDFEAGSFDCVVCADVLEHLERPDRVLRRIRQWLAPHGKLIASIPNARHHSVVGGLLEGNWTYERAGLLDNTHFRFFTRLDIERLLYRCGFAVSDLGIVPGPGHDEWVAKGRPGQVRLGWLDVVGIPPAEAEEYFVYQYLVDAVPAPVTDFDLTSIVILTHNGLAYTRQCLASVRAYTDEPYELVLVDNGSTDGTLEFLRNEQGVTLIANPENRGFPAAANQGIEASRGRQVLLLNNDVVVTTGWLRRMLEALRAESGAGLVGPMTNWPESPQQAQGAYREDLLDLDRFAFEWGRAHDRERSDVGEVIGFCLLIDRPVIEAIGILDEEFGIGQCEDKDYSARVKAAGFRTIVARDAYVHHHGHRTFLDAGIDSADLLRRNLARFRSKPVTASPVTNGSTQHNQRVAGAVERAHANEEPPATHVVTSAPRKLVRVL